MAKLRNQNDKLREELQDLTKQLETYIEKQRVQKQPQFSQQDKDPNIIKKEGELKQSQM